MKKILLLLALSAGLLHAQTNTNVAPPVALPEPIAAPPAPPPPPSFPTPLEVPSVLLAPAQVANLGAFIAANITLPSGVTQQQIAEIVIHPYWTGAVIRGATTVPLSSDLQKGDLIVPAGLLTAFPNGIVIRGGSVLPFSTPSAPGDIVIPPGNFTLKVPLRPAS